mmetsp:Transcript_71840/g.116497  ORF Transcript_71840/g.116497 Transcript_71840/m.116497 type:complete len:200 (+) Transcript_71840:221-820(+)
MKFQPKEGRQGVQGRSGNAKVMRVRRRIRHTRQRTSGRLRKKTSPPRSLHEYQAESPHENTAERPAQSQTKAASEPKQLRPSLPMRERARKMRKLLTRALRSKLEARRSQKHLKAAMQGWEAKMQSPGTRPNSRWTRVFWASVILGIASCTRQSFSRCALTRRTGSLYGNICCTTGVGPRNGKSGSRKMASTKSMRRAE